MALADFAARMLVATNYGYFRDELYCIAAGPHLSSGYADLPPLIALLARLPDVPAGDAPWSIYVGPCHRAPGLGQRAHTHLVPLTVRRDAVNNVAP